MKRALMASGIVRAAAVLAVALLDVVLLVAGGVLR